jgi:hypothetical protein
MVTNGVASKVPIMHMNIVGVQVALTGSSPSSYLFPSSYFSLLAATSLSQQLLLFASSYFYLPVATSVSQQLLLFPPAATIIPPMLCADPKLSVVVPQ